MAISKTTRVILSSLGLILSLYAVYVEHRIEHRSSDEDDFVALCDIQAIGASCSTVFSLPQGKLLSYFGLVPHGHMLDLPNAMYGAIFYLQQLVWGRMPLLVVGAFVTSVYLAYQLTFVLGDLCILCWSTHVINTTLFAYAVLLPLLSKFRSPSKQGHKVSKQA